MYETFEDELDAIRLKIYEDIKGMTPEEHCEYFRRKTASAIKEFNIKTNPLKPCRPVKREYLLA